MNKRARAAVFTGPNQPFEIREFPLRSTQTGEVLVRVIMATICRSDIHSYQGHRSNPCPGILGHEIIGIIEQLGPGIKSDMRGEPLAIGDRITWTEYYSRGDDYYEKALDLPQKSRDLHKYGHESSETDPHLTGGFAEYSYILPGTGILKLPAGISDEEATPLNCGIATMICVAEYGQITDGDTVVILGLGLLGIYGCAIAKSRGACNVIGLDANPNRLSMALRYGADETVDISGRNPAQQVEKIRELCPPDGADCVIEVCGQANAIPGGLEMLRAGGMFVIAGIVNPGSPVTIDANLLLRRYITLKGVHNYHPRHLGEALDFVMTNRVRFPFHDLVEKKYSLEEIDQAFSDAASQAILRAAIVP